jgi:hypothetical protein
MRFFVHFIRFRHGVAEAIRTILLTLKTASVLWRGSSGEMPRSTIGS